MKFFIYRLGVSTLLFAAIFALSACNRQASSTSIDTNTVMQVYKSPQCGCCQKWVDHAEQAGFEVAVQDTSALNQIKSEHGIKPVYQSCHTAVWNNGQYIFEGHIPARVIEDFLREAPGGDALGLAVPGMPLGSPGMEMREKFMPYDVLLLKKDGTSAVYVHISEQSQQY